MGRNTVKGMIGIKYGALSSIAAFTAFTASGAVQAQETDSITPGMTERSIIVVTATKREEQLQDVPFAVSAIDQNTLSDRAVSDIQDIVDLVPNLQVGVAIGGTTSNISIRGVGPQPFGTATVLTYVDGFTTGVRTDVNSALFDLERIEVLRGPQATLFGRNALGGAINYVTAKPGNEFESRGQMVVANYNEIMLRGSVAVPLIEDVLAVRIAGAYSERDGFYDNIATGAENVDGTSNVSFRGHIRFTPGTRFESNLQISYTKANNDCGECTLNISGFDRTNPSELADGTLDINKVSRVINQDVLGDFRRPITTVIWNNEYEFEGVTLTSLTGYSKAKIFQIGDPDRENGPFIIAPGFGLVSTTSRDRNETFSQEIRLSSNGSSPFQWIVGGYYFQQDHDFSASALTTFDTTLPFNSFEENIENYAVFLSATYDITDRLQLGLGLRYDHENVDQFNVLVGDTISVDSEELLPRFTALYRLNDDINIYSTVARGYRSGGVNPSTAGFGSAPQDTYDPESLWSYEFGVKGNLENGITFDLAGFYIDWSDQQVTTSNGGFLTFITNAGASEVYGIEGSLSAEVSDNFRIQANAAWTHARYQDFLDLSGLPVAFGVPAQRAGGRLNLAPDFSGTVTGEFRHPVGVGDWDFKARASLRYVGKRAVDSLAIAIADPYATADIAIGFENENFEISAFANNLTDTKYANFIQLFPGFRPLVEGGEPRRIGVKLDFHF